MQDGRQADKDCFVDALSQRNQDYRRLLDQHKACQAKRDEFGAAVQELQQRVAQLQAQLQSCRVRQQHAC